MGDTRRAERTSSSVFLPRAADKLLLNTLERRLAAVAQLPIELLTNSEDLQVVHYAGNSSILMYH